MIECALCHNQDGPFCIIEYRRRVMMICEDCENLIKHENDLIIKKYARKVERKKKNDTANICD